MLAAAGWAGDSLSIVTRNPDWHRWGIRVSWNTSQLFTGICLITPSHLLLPWKVIFLWGAGTADVSAACSIGHCVSVRIEERRQTIISLSVIFSLCFQELIFKNRITTNSHRSAKLHKENVALPNLYSTPKVALLKVESLGIHSIRVFWPTTAQSQGNKHQSEQ